MQLRNVGNLLLIVVPRLRTDRAGVPTPVTSEFFCSGCNGLVDSRFYDRRMF